MCLQLQTKKQKENKEFSHPSLQGKPQKLHTRGASAGWNISSSVALFIPSGRLGSSPSSVTSTLCSSIKSRGNLLSRGERPVVARRHQSRGATGEYILYVYILNNTITLFKTSIPFVRIHLIDDNTNPVRFSKLYSIVAERGDDFGEHLVFFL